MPSRSGRVPSCTDMRPEAALHRASSFWLLVENGVNPGSWNPGIDFQKLKWQPRLSADNRRCWELITERCDGFAVADRCNPHLPRLSAGIAGFSQLLVSQYMAIADAGHPLRSRQMALMSAFGALGLCIRVNMQYRTRRLLPRYAVRVGVEQADVGDQI